MGCKPCQDRWRIFLANESNNNIMKKDNLKETTEETVETVNYNVTSDQRLDVDKLVAERRAKAESNKIITK